MIAPLCSKCFGHGCELCRPSSLAPIFWLMTAVVALYFVGVFAMGWCR